MPDASARVKAMLQKIEAPLATQALKKALGNAYKQSLYATSQHLLGFKDVNMHTHRDVIAALESDTKRKLLCIPRGCLKSTIACVAYPIWLLLNNPNLRILIDSELYTNSKTFLREIKGQLERPEFIELFGSFKRDPWNEGEITIKQRTKILKEASITCSGIGATKVGQHYDVMIMDDMNGAQNSQTPEACEKVIAHYRGNISILEPDGILVIIGTRWSELDLIGHVIRNELGIDGIPETGELEVQGLMGGR